MKDERHEHRQACPGFKGSPSKGAGGVLADALGLGARRRRKKLPQVRRVGSGQTGRVRGGGPTHGDGGASGCLRGGGRSRRQNTPLLRPLRRAVTRPSGVVGERPVRAEGEDGSPNLPAFVRRNEELSVADACLWEGSMKDESGRPMIFCGTKGLLYVELRAKGASHDLHSMYGGLAPNPAWRLVQALRTIKDENGEITLDGLEELIEPPSKEDLKAIEEIPFDEPALKASWGVEAFDRNLTGKEALKEYLLRPTANIAGIQSGYTGPGSKTIVPSEAFVKMDFRLVAGQSPGPVLELIRSHLRKRGFDDVEVVELHGVEPAKTPVDSPVVRTALETWQDLGESEAVVYPTIGGSGPTSLLVADLGIPTVMTGSVANAGSRLHSPNEWVHLDDYYEAISYFARFFERYAL